MPWWIWLLLGFFLALLELLTPTGFFLLFFGIAAMVVGLIAALYPSCPFWLEWVLFGAISVVAVVLFRRPVREKFRVAIPHTEVDTLAGETAVATQDIAAGAVGKVELRGSTWSARNESENPIQAGQRCVVLRVDGLTLVVRSP